MRIPTLVASLFVSSATIALPLEKLTLPEGFDISVYADDVTNARQMALGANGVVFVGSRRAGLLHALVDKDGDGVSDETILIDDELNMPSGITYRDGALYVAEVDRILKYPDIDRTFGSSPEPEVAVSGLPTEKHHGWKYIDFSPDGWLHIPVGAPCNICETNGDDKWDNPEFSSILKYNLDTGERAWVAKGVRNSVGFDWHPDTGEFWFSDNGRDMMGDDIPPCEINRVGEEGAHYGYPYFHGGVIADPEFGQGKDMNDFVQPSFNLQAHVAPLGIHFYRGKMFPSEYQSRLFVAEHGSWNRSSKVGYRVMMATIKDNVVVGYEPFIEGFLEADDTYWGRPVALLPMPDGSLLVSDDFANAVYRITYKL